MSDKLLEVENFRLQALSLCGEIILELTNGRGGSLSKLRHGVGERTAEGSYELDLVLLIIFECDVEDGCRQVVLEFLCETKNLVLGFRYIRCKMISLRS